MKVLLNLLPEEGRKRIRQKYYARFFLWQSIFLLSIEVFFIMLLGGTFLVLQVNMDSLRKAEEIDLESHAEAKMLKEFEEKFRNANDISAQTIKFSREHLRWTELFLRLNRLVPEGVMIGRLSTKEYQVFLSGNALTRDDLLLFEKQLKSDNCFKAVNVPVSNLFSQKNVEFQIDFFVEESCLKTSTL